MQLLEHRLDQADVLGDGLGPHLVADDYAADHATPPGGWASPPASGRRQAHPQYERPGWHWRPLPGDRDGRQITRIGLPGDGPLHGTNVLMPRTGRRPAILLAARPGVVSSRADLLAQLLRKGELRLDED